MENKIDKADASILNEKALTTVTVEKQKDDILLFEELKPYKLFISDIIY